MTRFSWGSRPEDARCSVLGARCGRCHRFPSPASCCNWPPAPSLLPRAAAVSSWAAMEWTVAGQRPVHVHTNSIEYNTKQLFFLCVCVCQGLAPRMSCVLDSHPRNARSLFPKQSANGSRGGTHKASAFPAQPVPLLSLLDPMSQVVSAGWENHVVAKLARQTTKGPEEGRGGGGGGEKRKAGTSFFSFPVSQSAPCIAAQVGIA